MGKPRYDTSKGDDLYRRSLYTFWKRTVPPPSMITFDASERNVCSVKRQATSTPLQVHELMRRDTARWRRVIRSANVKPDWEDLPQ